MGCYIPSTHSTIIVDTVKLISTVILITNTSSDDYLSQSITEIIYILEDPKPTVPYISFGYDTQNSLKKIATLLDRAIPAPKTIKTTLTPIYPQPTLPLELAPKSTVVAPQPEPDLRVVSYTVSVPRVEVPSQPSPPKSEHKQASYKLISSTKKSCYPNIQYIHPSQYHTRSTALEKLLIKEYDKQILHLYHTFTGAKETYNSLRNQDTVKWETSFSDEIVRLAQGVGTCIKTVNENILFISRSKVPSGRNIM